jgi:hypothetical protein
MGAEARQSVDVNVEGENGERCNEVQMELSFPSDVVKFE